MRPDKNARCSRSQPFAPCELSRPDRASLSKWKNYALWALFTFVANSLAATVREEWVQRYNSPITNSVNRAVKVAKDANGDIVVTGTTDDRAHAEDFLTVKYSGTTGAMLWQHKFSGPGNFSGTPYGLVVDAGGDVIVAGRSGGPFTSGFYTAKYAGSDGALLWERRTNGVAQSVAVSASGDVVVTGYTGDTSSDYYTAKYAALDGALLWDRSYSFSTNSDDRAVAVALDASGNAVVTGISSSRIYTTKYAAANGTLLWESRGTNGTLQAMALDPLGNPLVTGYVTISDRDFYTAKFSGTNGAFIWERRFSGVSTTDEGRAIAADAGGNVIVTGITRNNSGDDFYTAKYAAANGALLWSRQYNGPANGFDNVFAVALDAAGNAVVTGASNGLTNGVATSSDYYTAKYAASNGALLWEQRLDKPASAGEDARAVALDSNGNVIVTGTVNPNTGPQEFLTVKYAGTDGMLLLEMRYSAIGNTSEEARAVTFAPDGNVLVTGFANNSNQVPHFYTAKYAAANGTLLWSQRSADTNGTQEFAYDVAADNEGNAIVTGVSYRGSNRDIYTAKYAAADGAMLWERRYDGPLASADEPAAVKLDAHGNVIVTGFSTGLSNGVTSQDFYTAKYAAADGALLWENRYNSPSNRSEAATALAVDHEGNAIVTGRASNGSNTDFYTAKYAAANGAQLWERRYNSPANRDDLPAAVACDSSGNAIVAGISSNDLYVAKYAAADGALRWEVRYNNPTNDIDRATAVAVDADGNVAVTGYSRNASGTSRNLYTAKYAAATGELLWEHLYYGRGNEGIAIAFGDDGDVVITGLSSPGDADDFYTAKYRGADGLLLWEKRYNGPANGTELLTGTRSLALGPNRTVAIAGASDGSYLSSSIILDFTTVLYREPAPAAIAVQPQNRLAECGAATSLSVAATGDEPLSYQWFFQGAVVGVASNLIVTANAFTSGNYFAVVSNEFGSVTSIVATLTVQDTTPPRFGLILDKIVNCAHVPAPANPTVTDDCDPSPVVTFSEFSTPGSCPQSYTLTRVWTARDASGNAATGTQTLTVQDGTAPVLTGQGTNKTISCPGTPVFTAPFATDNCDTNPVISFLDDVVPGVGTANYTITRTWFAIDACENISQPVSQIISVVDTAPPEFVCPAPFTLDATNPAGTVAVFTNLLASDCEPEVTVQSSPASGSVLPIGTNIVTWTATDLSGNSNTCEISVVVLGPRGILESVLAELISAQPGVTNRAEQRRLKGAITYLAQTTNAAFWIDDQHLEPATARRVFQRGKLATTRLRSILAYRVVPRGPVALPDPLVLGWMTRLANANRLLAEFAVDEAEKRGGDVRQISACRKLIARGTTAAVAHRTPNAITLYQEAWRRAEKIRASQRR
jgi:uncharacterized delta-60 repeat protein